MLRLFAKKYTKFTCPICIQELDAKDIFYICGKCNNKVDVEAKMILKKRPIKCKCGGIAKMRACSKCSDAKMMQWSEIPRAVLEVPYFPFCIAGAPGSGKTNYITIMLEALQNIEELRLAVMPLNSDAEERQAKHKELIHSKQKPDPDPEGEKPVPQIWQIQKVVERKKKSPTFTFTIYDGAGEHSMGNTDENIIGYIMFSEAVIITIDPLTLNHVRGKLNEVDVTNSERDYDSETRTSADVALKNVCDFIKAARGLSADDKLDIPAAIVLTKFDTILNSKLKEDLGPNVKDIENFIFEQKINIDQIDKASEEIEYFLEKNKEVPFVNYVRANFNQDCYKFFGVSSYGKPPVSKEELNNEIIPHRITDPILWLLHRKKIIE